MSHDPASTKSCRLRETFKAFWADEQGSTVIGYSLIAGIIVLAIVGTVGAIGESLKTDYYEPVSAGLSGIE
ncbi:Flp family type IVb pilin [Breoghania sp.]|uniref:Flp family type IVb pilin n=1 Tax=Breoghania sp. TaxID=2065378 RepID=UPI00261C6F88|nr:Flp family type IVb pilin [Breoghania sp.]MDJ0932551.1 Flp family type IVb pilin [Breoghania sp.]